MADAVLTARHPLEPGNGFALWMEPPERWGGGYAVRPSRHAGARGVVDEGGIEMALPARSVRKRGRRTMRLVRRVGARGAVREQPHSKCHTHTHTQGASRETESPFAVRQEKGALGKGHILAPQRQHARMRPDPGGYAAASGVGRPRPLGWAARNTPATWHSDPPRLSALRRCLRRRLPCRKGDAHIPLIAGATRVCSAAVSHLPPPLSRLRVSRCWRRGTRGEAGRGVGDGNGRGRQRARGNGSCRLPSSSPPSLAWRAAG